jgi:hypothetical protein
VHHQVLDMSLAHDIASERLRDHGPSQLWQILALAIGLLVPALDGESGVRDVVIGVDLVQGLGPGLHRPCAAPQPADAGGWCTARGAQ